VPDMCPPLRFSFLCQPYSQKTPQKVPFGHALVRISAAHLAWMQPYRSLPRILCGLVFLFLSPPFFLFFIFLKGCCGLLLCPIAYLGVGVFAREMRASFSPPTEGISVGWLSLMVLASLVVVTALTVWRISVRISRRGARSTAHLASVSTGSECDTLGAHAPPPGTENTPAIDSCRASESQPMILEDAAGGLHAIELDIDDRSLDRNSVLSALETAVSRRQYRQSEAGASEATEMAPQSSASALGTTFQQLDVQADEARWQQDNGCASAAAGPGSTMPAPPLPPSNAPRLDISLFETSLRLLLLDLQSIRHRAPQV
jgi:hypothetical protein